MSKILKQDHIHTLAGLASDQFIQQTARSKIIEVMNWIRDITPLQFHDCGDVSPAKDDQVLVECMDGSFIVCVYDGFGIWRESTTRQRIIKPVRKWAILKPDPYGASKTLEKTENAA